MVLKKDSDYLEIIDGQQRIATVYIVLSVIRRVLRENGDNDRADWFNHKYFGKQDVVTLQREPKFHMNEVNDPLFQKFVGADSGVTRVRSEMKGFLKKDPNYLLLQAIMIMWELVQSRQMKMSGQEFDLETLLSIEKYLREHVFVLLLTVTDEADAYIIFETLNDRGRGLTTMDLLKNHVFGKSGGYLDQVKAFWTTIRDNLTDIDPRERFLYHYWTSHQGRTSKSMLFRLMRGNVKTPESAVDFAENLCEASKLYLALSIPGHPYWNSYDHRTRENLETLNLLDAQQAFPIMLAAAEEFSGNEFGKLTDILVAMAVRYNLIGELRTGVAANYYVEIPPKIRSGQITKSAQVFRALKPIYPSDRNFEEAFATKVLKDTRKARYLLSKIEEHEHKETQQVAGDTRKVNLEHILPKNPSSTDWKDTIASIGRDELDDYTYRLGNLALVSSAVNRRVGAQGFERKKEILFEKEEHITFTKMVAGYPSWLRADIEDRQRKLAKRAVRVWHIDIR
jgi:hypothetical protein